MKMATMLIGSGLALSMMILAGNVLADDTGAGVCVLGVGTDLNDNTGAGPYAGVNVGQNSATGVYSTSGDFETQCCAETGSAPDCFAPVQSSASVFHVVFLLP